MENVNKMRQKMKTNITGFIACFILLAALTACETADTQKYDKSTDGVFFGTYTADTDYTGFLLYDTTRLSFGNLPDPTVESHVFEFPYVQLMGMIADHDRAFNMEMAKGPTNPATRFEIVPSVMKAGEHTASFSVKLYNTENLSVRDTVTIQFADAPELIALPTLMPTMFKPTHTFILYNGVDRPAWWIDWYVTEYLGRYDELKLQILQTVLGSTDDPTADTAKWPLIQAVLNQYCEDNDIKYPGTDEDLWFIGENYL